MSSAVLNVGIIGVGRMGELHLKKFLANPDCRVSGVFEANAERRQQLEETYSVKGYAQLSDILFDSDAVVIAAPTALHYSIARQALEAGVHVLVEKPMTETVREAETLVELARAKKLLFQVGFVERYRYLALSKISSPSTIRFIECDRLSLAPGRETTVDVVSDLMIHDLDLVLSLIREEPSYISATGVPIITKQCDMASVRLEFPGGAVANLSASRVSAKVMRKFRLFSMDAYASIDLLTNASEVFSRGKDNQIERKTYESSALDALKEQCEQFVNAVAKGGPPGVSGHDGLRALRVAIEIQRKIEERAAWRAPEPIASRSDSSFDLEFRP